MRPYYEDESVTLYLGDCRELLPELVGTVISDPPYNVGYQYATYKDNLGREDYRTLIQGTLRTPSVVIHYPEEMFEVAAVLGKPAKVAAWVYNANTPRKFRLVAWFGTKPDFGAVSQPYKNPHDNRIARLTSEGSEGTPLYDWWNVEQVKNVSGEKTGHPCQIPLSVMRRVVGVTEPGVVIDPFAGSGTTLRAAKDLGRKAVGFEIDERYCDIAAKRCSQEVLPLGEVA